ncbi:MAG: FAD:protein FMN transferase [Sporichthyaceae bacterium]
MPISVLARGPGARDDDAASAVERVFAELRAVDVLFSPYRADSEVSRIGRGELALDAADPSVRDVAERCERARAATGGAFDAVRPDGTWDPTGLVKGWAVERAAGHLAALPAVDWCLNAGGDVAILAPSGETFGVGILDPLDPARIAAVLHRASGGVATSGGSARGEHLYDPRTRRAARARWASVTVAGPSLETADVLATAAFVSGAAWSETVAAVPDYIGLAIAADGSRATIASDHLTWLPPTP